MLFFKKLFKRKKEPQPYVTPSATELAEIMYDKELNYKDKIISVTYSADKTYRYVILQSDKNFLTYQFEALHAYDEEEMNYFRNGGLPAYWYPTYHGYKPVFENIDELMKELKAEPEYIVYFKTE